MSDDLSFLEDEATVQSQAIIKEISMHAETLQSMHDTMVEAEEAFKQAKRTYDDFRLMTLPNIMRLAGVDMLKTTSGAVVQVKENFYCSPNKNADDRKIMVDWLRSQGGENLVKNRAEVDAAFIKQLEEYAVPFNEVTEVNTNSLKAWIKGQIGSNGGVAQFQIEDIPDCVHFIKQDECTIVL